MKDMTLEQIVRAVDGTFHTPDDSPEWGKKEVQGVVIDNRKLQEGDLFVAMTGARVDGHRFIPDALAAGAVAALSEQELDVPGPYILVKDTAVALKELAAYYRSVLPTYIIGIVGSVGKTSTKEMVASVLSQHFGVWKTPGNFNNEIGLPLTLLGIRKEHRVAVVEMGISDFGEMDRLGKIAKPDMVIMTNIGLCHLENLGTRDGILQAKTEVIDHMPEDGILILNADDDKLKDANVRGRKAWYYGLHGQEFWAENIGGTLSSVRARLHTPEWDGEVEIPLPGKHNIYNALAAAAAGVSLGLSKDEIVKGICHVKTTDGRNNLLTCNEVTIIDDCYNANPVSMVASLEVLGHATGRKIAVLGDMGELGEKEKELHYQIGNAVAEHQIDLLFTVGPLAQEIGRCVRDLEAETEVFSFTEKETMIEELKRQQKKGDTILIKASHFMNFETVVEAITKEE